MLDAFRKKTNNLLFTILILLIVAVMAMFGMDQLGTGGAGSGGAAAWVNGEMISAAEFQDELQARVQQYQQILGSQYDEKLLLSLRLPQQTLEQLIQFKVLAQQAKKMNLNVANRELADHIRSLPYFQVDGKFDAARYRQIPNKGFLEQRQRERLQLVKLQTYVRNLLIVSPAEVKQNFQVTETKIDLSFAAIDFKEITKKYTPTAAEIKKTLKETSEDALKREYDSNVSQFTTPAQYKFRQIRAAVPFRATDKKKKEAKDKVTNLQKTITAENFSDIAKKNSDDEFAQNGGARNWVSEELLEAPIKAALINLKAGQISGVVEAPSGFYILQSLEKRDKKVAPLAEVRPKVAKLVATKSYEEKFRKDMKTKWEASLSKGRNIESDLRRYGIKMEKTGMFSVKVDRIPKIGPSEEVLDAALRLSKVNAFSTTLIPFEGKLYFVKLGAIQKPKGSFEKKWKEIDTTAKASLQTEFFSRWMESLRKQALVKQVIQFNQERLPL